MPRWMRLATVVVLAMMLAAARPAVAQLCPDADQDGLCDDSDSCISTGPPIDGMRLRLRKLLLATGEQRIRWAGVVTLPDPSLVDPEQHGLRLVMRDAVGVETVDVTLPPGAWDSAAQRGWISNGSGLTLRYRDRAGTVNGILMALVKRRPGSNELRVIVFGRPGLYTAPTELPAHVAVIFDPAATGELCGEANFTKCWYLVQGNKMYCSQQE